MRHELDQYDEYKEVQREGRHALWPRPDTLPLGCPRLHFRPAPTMISTVGLSAAPSETGPCL